MGHLKTFEFFRHENAWECGAENRMVTKNYQQHRIYNLEKVRFTQQRIYRSDFPRIFVCKNC